MIDYFAINKTSYAHLTDVEIVGKIDKYCARLIEVAKNQDISVLGTCLSSVFIGMSHDADSLLHNANERFEYKHKNPQDKPLHLFLSQIAEAATRRGIKTTGNIADYADIYERTHILLRQMPKHKTSGIQGVFTAAKTMKNVAKSHTPRF